MTWIILGAIWLFLYLLALLFAKLAHEDDMRQPLLVGLVPILGSIFAIYSYCVIIASKPPKKQE